MFLQQLPDDADPVVYNQDLVGFFTSIPVFRILHAVRWAVTEYCLVKNVDPETTSFSVNLQEQDSKLRIWKGRPRKAAKRTVLIQLSPRYKASFLTTANYSFALVTLTIDLG